MAIGPVVSTPALVTAQPPTVTELGLLVGNLTCAGVVGFGDINPSVLQLSDPAGCQATCSNGPTANGDINGYESVGLDDVSVCDSIASVTARLSVHPAFNL